MLMCAIYILLARWATMPPSTRSARHDDPIAKLVEDSSSRTVLQLFNLAHGPGYSTCSELTVPHWAPGRGHGGARLR